MLESASLLVRPPGPSAARAVVEPATGAALGWVRRGRGGLWGRWLGRPVLEVREGGDEPLLFTVRRLWLRPGVREVRDADGRLVGAVAAAGVWDRDGLPLARRVAADGAGEAFHGPTGRVLARLRRQDGATHLQFTPEVQADPFVKMLMLAAALGW